ncbi:MAG TPA: hypothetical protein VN829_21385 [Dongiaceae bacterium]|nr:hypothetical protein [Dongiaceae bacterium]
MAFGAQLPVRLEPEIEERLESIARDIGTSKSALIRLLVSTFVKHVVDQRGRVRLPPDWSELLGQLPAADKRSVEARSGRVLARHSRAPAPPAPSSRPASAAAKLLRQQVPSAPRRGAR